MANQQPTLQSLGEAAYRLKDLQRRRKIDEEAARLNLMAQANARQAAAGLMQTAMEIGNASPEMKAVYDRQADQRINDVLQREQPGIQDFLLRPENLPAQSKKGLGGVFQRLFTPSIPQEYSDYQQGLLSNTLAGQPIASGERYGEAGQVRPTGMLSFEPPEQRAKTAYQQSQTAENLSRAKYQGQSRPSAQSDTVRALKDFNDTVNAAMAPFRDEKGNVDRAAAGQDPYVQRLIKMRDLMMDKAEKELAGPPVPDITGPPTEAAQPWGEVPFPDSRLNVPAAADRPPAITPAARPQDQTTSRPEPVEVPEVEAKLATTTPPETRVWNGRAITVGKLYRGNNGKFYRITGFGENGAPQGEETE